MKTKATAYMGVAFVNTFIWFFILLTLKVSGTLIVLICGAVYLITLWACCLVGGITWSGN